MFICRDIRMNIELIDKDVNNLKETLLNIFQTIWSYNYRNDKEFDVELISLTYGEWETLVKITKELFTLSEIEELNSRFEIPEAEIKRLKQKWLDSLLRQDTFLKCVLIVI